MNLIKSFFVLNACFVCNFLFAQEKKEVKKWDVSNPQGNYKEVNFSTNEGTWMNVDVSPDGKEIVFDLLGDIYSMPVAGGPTVLLRGGHAFEVQPRFSPDGKKILFTSDAGGGDNIWVMNRDATNPVQVTNESFRLLNNAAWSPDGEYIVARKHFTSTRSLGAGELWMYHRSGGNGLQLTVRKNDQQDVNEPVFSPDGKYIYFSEDVYPGGAFQYNKDPNNNIFSIRRFDREKGTVENVTGGPGGAVRPQISHNGKWLAFIKRVRTKTVLYMRDLLTAEEWPVYDSLSKDQQEAWTVFGSYPNYAFTADDKQLLIWSNGKILKVDAQRANKAIVIPFVCQVKQRIYDVPRFQQELNPDTFYAKVIRNAVTSPDGKTLVFHAVGYLWKKLLPAGKPERLVNNMDASYRNAGFEWEPSFTADGKQIVFVTWSDSLAGAMYTISTQGATKPVKITALKGLYRQPSFSTDGRWIVFRKEGGNNAVGSAFTAQPGIYTMSANGSNENFVTERGDMPRFNNRSNRVYYQLGAGMNRTFASNTTDGRDERIHLKSTYGSQFRVSPDEQWVAFVDLHNVYVAAFPITGRTTDLGSGTKDFPVKVISKDAGTNLHWSADSKNLLYTLGSQYFKVPLQDRFQFIAGIADSSYTPPATGVDVGLQVKTDKPSGSIVFTNARIITMNGAEVIENGTLVVESNVIKAIGQSGTITIPAGAKQIDCSGKTIMPGFIDAHAHGNHFSNGLVPQKSWPYYANLAYGVTSMHDPSANSEYVFGSSELVKTGQIVGPRIFSTGTILYGADGDIKAVVNSLEDARSALRRTMAFGAFSVKSYNQPRREQRQMIIQAARELRIEVVPEGGSFFYHNVSMILDGHTTIEHNMPVAPLYNDVVQLWKNSNTAYTPTLIVNYAGLSGEYYWYQHSNVWEKERLMRFTPRAVIDTRSRHRTMVPEEEYENGHILTSKSVKKLADEGVIVNMGAHGQLQGLGAHWEIWMMQQGGMTNMQALQTATINPARSLGFDNYIGSLQTGKLADLIVMDKNPLVDIRNTESIVYTMVNGRLYNAEQMNETGNQTRQRPKFYWELNRNADSFPWHDQTLEQGCGCARH